MSSLLSQPLPLVGLTPLQAALLALAVDIVVPRAWRAVKLRVEKASRKAERARIGPTSVPPLTLDTVSEEFSRVRTTFDAGISRDIEWRRKQLFSLLDMLEEHRNDILHAVRIDLGKDETETQLMDYIFSVSEIKHLAHQLPRLARPRRVWPSLASFPSRCYVRYEPRGVVLVIGTWNYSIGLSLVPLAGAIAGGNCVVLKLSESAPAIGSLLASLISKYLDMRAITLEYEGGAPVVSALLAQPIDMVFFTGSSRVGRIISETVAPRMVPCVLELGGKNSCIVDGTVDPVFAARRIAWGKWVTAGQTCIAPDHLVVVDPEGLQGPVVSALVSSLKSCVLTMFSATPKNSQFCRIVSPAAAKRLARLIEDNKNAVVLGGEVDAEERYVSPTIMLLDAASDTPLLRDEVFGPVLPVIAVPTVDAAIAFVNSRDTALALHVFTTSSEVKDRVASCTRSGALMLNETLVHFATPNLPFGGCGTSGIGSYHGKRTFKAFVHERAVVESIPWRLLDIPLRYPPYTWFHRNIVIPIMELMS